MFEIFISSIVSNKEFIGLVVAIISIIVAIRGNNKQLSTDAFISYTEKYDNLVILKLDEWRKKDELKIEDIKDTEILSNALNKYLHLCCQQYYLYQTGMIRKAVWSIWKPEIEHNLQTDLLINYWDLEGEKIFVHYPSFKNYAMLIQRKKRKENREKVEKGVKSHF